MTHRESLLRDLRQIVGDPYGLLTRGRFVAGI